MSRYLTTGAASGIGQALAAQLIASGHDVIGVDRSLDGIPDGCTKVHADLSDVADLDRVLAGATNVDGLANVAGVPGTAPSELVIRVNFLAARRLGLGVAGLLTAPGGVVNVSSLAARRPGVPDQTCWQLASSEDEEVLAYVRQSDLSGSAAYDLSKKLLNCHTTLLAADLAPRGVRANSVSPGPVDTPIIGDFRTSMGPSVDAAADILGRHANAQEIAGVVAFLLSPEASWLSGIDLPADGGLLAVRTASSLQGASA